ncbi:hypothetical protein Tco_0388202, partial [Tanacetum coccineum]
MLVQRLTQRTQGRIVRNIVIDSYVVPTGRVKVPAGRYVVSTGRVKIPAGRYVVPTGKDN